MPKFFVEVKNRYMNINVGLAKEMLKRSREKEFRLYLTLKVFADGNGAYFTENDRFEIRNECASVMDCSKRTVHRRMKTLENIGWIGKDENSTRYIRSFGYLLNRYDVDTTIAHRCCIRYVCSDLDFFKSTLMSIDIGDMINRRQTVHQKTQKNENSVSIYGDISRVCSSPKFDEKDKNSPEKAQQKKTNKIEIYTPRSLSLSFLASRYNKSKSTIHRRKKDASRRGLLDRQKHTHRFRDREGRPMRNLDVVKQAYPSEAHRIHLSWKEGGVCMRLTDTLNCKLQLSPAAHQRN